MTIDIQSIVTGVSVAVTSALVVDKVYRRRGRDKEVDKMIRKSKSCDPDKMANDIKRIEKKVNRSYDTENEMLKNDLVIMDGLEQLGANGRVTERREEMHKYLIERR